MEKRGEGKEGIPVLALAKCLLVSYVLTLLLLCLLALLLYKLHLTYFPLPLHIQQDSITLLHNAFQSSPCHRDPWLR